MPLIDRFRFKAYGGLKILTDYIRDEAAVSECHLGNQH